MKTINGYTFFWKDKIAQWNMTNFTDGKTTYSCAEQYMMAKKAELFKDPITLNKILKSTNPKDIKSLGREVKNYKEEIWNLHKSNIVIEGNMLKFGQNPELKKILLSTGDTILVEASPYDKIWGIGLGVEDEDILDESKWKGQNLLGKALMVVRERLK